MVRKSLSQILAAGTDCDRLRRQWADAKPADDFATPLPRGEYVARIISGELVKSKTNSTPGYNLCFQIIEGEHTGRKFWHDIWLSEKAIAMAKRDLGRLGVTSIDQLDQPLPTGIRCRVKLGVRKDEDGAERNRVRTFEVVGIDTPELDAFAPKTNSTDAVPPNSQPTAIAEPSPDGGQHGDMCVDRHQLDGESDGAT